MYEGRIISGGKTQASGSIAATSAINGAWTLGEVTELLWRARALILTCLLIGLAGAVVFLAMATPRYAAGATIIVDPSELRIVDRSLKEQNSYSDAQIAQVENYVRTIMSTSVLGAVVDAQHLDRNLEFIGSGPSVLDELKQSLGAPAPSADARLQAIRSLTKDVTVKREERTYVVQIVVTTRDASQSVRLADAIVSAFLGFSADQHTASSRRIAASLQSRLNELRQSVETADQKLVDYRQQHGIVAAVGQSVTEAQLAEASTSLGQARKRLEDLRSRYNQVLQAQRAGNPGSIPDALQSITISNLRSQLAQVVRRKGDMLGTLGPRHPMMAEVAGEERSVRELVREEIERVAAVAKSDLARAVQDQSAAEKTFADLKSSVGTNSQLSVRLRQLEREVEASRTVYEAFLVRTREVAEQEQINPSDIRIISGGQVLEGQSWPPRPLFVLIGGILAGLAGGAALTLFGGSSGFIPWLARRSATGMRYVG